ncbi:hypothetical protein [Parasitella parasitica]|uniref:Uncharacterized protein n=1 Tax=Parasitella parasitica TaxID=35722 RepID=A0A0B7NA64_9FUNG|nr:hypothetical protein [Parasitella parasitica]
MAGVPRAKSWSFSLLSVCNMSSNKEKALEIEQQLTLAKKENIIRFRKESSKLVLIFILTGNESLSDDPSQQQSLSRNLNEAIKLKYNQISEYITISSFSIHTIHQTMLQMDEQRSELGEKRLNLGIKVANYVKTVLEVLDETWTVIEQFKYKAQKDKNIAFDEYYGALVDTMLLKAKILQLSVIIETYDDPEFIAALDTLSLKHV